ncbi:MAG: formylmethanofuran dehydrogenase subunit C [Betaproteobacteria bacterium]|nr:formylmethanofuran dehydrogenase subunit C [Betaproteobacteria bacterium]
MAALTLTLRNAPARSIDLSPLTPQRLTGLDKSAIGALHIRGGLRVADVFDIDAGDAQHLVIRNSCDRLTHIGAAMRSGTITVEGDCGAYAGLGLNGGHLNVSGNAGSFAGSGMKAGLIQIHGNAGEFAGGALAGDRQGMRGGILAIHGDAGDRTGERMRRGLLLVGGNAGAYCGANMLAGTLFVAGKVGMMPGFSLKRGTLLLACVPDNLPVTFQDSGEHSLLFLTLLERQLQRDHPSFARFLPFSQKVRRYCGDLAWGGTGEILIFS